MQVWKILTKQSYMNYIIYLICLSVSIVVANTACFLLTHYELLSLPFTLQSFAKIFSLVVITNAGLIIYDLLIKRLVDKLYTIYSIWSVISISLITAVRCMLLYVIIENLLVLFNIQFSDDWAVLTLSILFIIVNDIIVAKHEVI